jgi:hypothetical protein
MQSLNSVRLRPKRIRFLILLTVVVFLLESFSCKTERGSGIQYEGGSPVSTVVIVTFDGVRPEEILSIAGPDLQSQPTSPREVVMPFLIYELGPSGIFLGHPEAGKPMTVANPIAVSLPGYQSMFSGRPTLCFTNECGPPMGETLFSRVQKAFNLPPESIAVFATWEGLCSGLGLDDRFDAHCGADAIREIWQLRVGRTAKDTRRRPETIDQAAFDLALHRLGKPLPMLLYVALDETDATAHAENYAGHLAALAEYDMWLRVLDKKLRELEADGHQTALIVTTDHGRGSGDDWSQHRWNVTGSDRVWLFARGPGLEAAGPVETSEKATLASVRPTVEKWLALKPTSGPLFGPSLTEIIDPSRIGNEPFGD